jgi:iron complex outermembrane recepter protein
MFKRKPLAIAIQAATVASLASTPALSQEPTLIEEVVVTGSRIHQANLVTSSPVTQLDAEQLAFSGATRVEDVLGSMPQVYLDQSRASPLSLRVRQPCSCATSASAAPWYW